MPVGQEVTAMIFFIRNGSGIMDSGGWTSDHAKRAVFRGRGAEQRGEAIQRGRRHVGRGGARFERRDELILGCVVRDIHPVLRGTGRLLAMASGYHRRKL